MNKIEKIKPYMKEAALNQVYSKALLYLLLSLLGLTKKYLEPWWGAWRTVDFNRFAENL